VRRCAATLGYGVKRLRRKDLRPMLFAHQIWNYWLWE